MKRFLSLDVFRGMTILMMIVLNNQAGGSVFAPLVHSSWDGVTLADMIFPFFLFIMGAAMWFSTHRHDYGIRGTLSKSRRTGRIFRRTLILFAIGLILNWIPFDDYFAFVRIPGVLQRIALAYFFAAMLTLYLPRVRAIVLSIAVSLAGYWFLLDALGTDIVGRVDTALLGPSHLLTPSFDPEGILSTIPAIASVLIGYLAGNAMDKPNSASGGIGTLMVVGVLLAGAGILFGLVSPMNKQLWTPSYVLFTSGAAMVVWSVLSFVIEYMQARKWCEFFTIAGTNSLFIYSLSMVLAKMFALWGVTQAVYDFYRSYHVPDAVASLMWSLTMALVCWLITWPLYRMRVFISA